MFACPDGPCWLASGAQLQDLLAQCRLAQCLGSEPERGAVLDSDFWVDCCRSARGAGAGCGGNSRSRITPAGFQPPDSPPAGVRAEVPRVLALLAAVLKTARSVEAAGFWLSTATAEDHQVCPRWLAHYAPPLAAGKAGPGEASAAAFFPSLGWWRGLRSRAESAQAFLRLGLARPD
jgi:hypothetical protein